MVGITEDESLSTSQNTISELPEILTAVTYWTSAVLKYDKTLPLDKIRRFSEELYYGLKQRCDGHWYPEDPVRGQGYRALICAERVDTLLITALQKAQLSLDLRQICGEEVVMYVDPGNVSVRLFPPYARGRNTVHTLFPSSGSSSPSSSPSSPSKSPSTSLPNSPPSSAPHHTSFIPRSVVQLA
eukprot:TRINITY_DN8620_c1_g1_i1.p1 TRINITY_DN8620_c1_g1~~TRINITY_DN8620_c1_g1_i1.p1  ORF type:complete len:185 (-),score=25.89 TRINITY_DN8620_c1_g1_i1:182-736(-)